MPLKLETFLDKYTNQTISDRIYEQHELFGYEYQDEFMLDLDFMCKNIYCVDIVADKKHNIRPIRLGQSEFRQQLLAIYNNKCIVTQANCDIELEAAHIRPYSENHNYDINNGLILKSNIHKTFDAYYWTIQPDTQQIIIQPNHNVGEILDYHLVKLDIVIPPEMYINLQHHYDIFMSRLL
jgi:hypothetical protein